MKKLNLVLGLFVMVGSIGFVSCKKGNGKMITSEKEVSSFEAVHISSSSDVYYHESQQYRAVVTVDENLLDYVVIKTKGNELRIGTKNGNYSFTKFVVDVYCPRVTKASISGSGSFECVEKMVVPTFEATISGSGNLKGIFECDDFSARISGSGKIDGTVMCNDFSTTISGSGKVTIVGESKNSTINISGSGDFKGREFKTNNADARISGSGDAYIWAIDYLKAHISGSGNIVYRGSPKIDFSGSGSGRMRSE